MRSISHLGTLCAGIVTAGALVAACEGPEADSFRRNGGASPDPTGIVEGTVLYVGPRPQCNEERTQILGNVVLTLFAYDNPPPPTGSASSALSLLTIPGETMFSLSDCMPAEPTDEDRRPIMRSADFTWPELSLGRTPCQDPNPDNPSCVGQDYQIRGFFDYDNDFNPFFSVRNLPTAGDIAGGAFVSTSAVPPQFTRIQFGNIEEQPNGQVVPGVAVTLGVPVSTERPAFEVADSTRAMEGDRTIPLTTDLLEREQGLWDMTQMRINPIVPLDAPGARPSDAWLAAMAAGGIDSSNYELGNPRYGFYIAPVDANSDGDQDLHPVLGSAGIKYYYPVPIVRRARNAVEQRLGLPDVLFVGTIRPSAVASLSGVTLQTMMSFDAVIPPVAVMATNPALPAQCRVPIIPPGNVTTLYERIPVDCQELPSGNYDVNVLAGLAGAQFQDENANCMERCLAEGRDEAACMGICAATTPEITQNGWIAVGGSFSSQAWSIPNDLGCPDTAYRPTALNQLDPVGENGQLPACGDEGSLMLPSQSRSGGFAVVDTDDDLTEEHWTSTTPGHGIEECTSALNPETGTIDPVEYMPIPAECCPPQLDQFCNLPLCPLRDATVTVPEADHYLDPAYGVPGYAYPEAVLPGRTGGARTTRELRVPGEDYVVNDDGSITPRCTPFLMPADCCAIAARCAADPNSEDCPR